MVPDSDYEAKEREEFAARLHQAMNDVPDIPAGHGRGAWLAKGMGVTTKAATKWLNGGGLPETAKIKKLAQLVQADPAWLLFGSESQGNRTAEQGDSKELRQITDAISKAQEAGSLSKDLVSTILQVISIAAPKAHPFPKDVDLSHSRLNGLYDKQSIVDNRDNLKAQQEKKTKSNQKMKPDEAETHQEKTK